MDNSVNAFIIAKYSEDRIAEGTSPRRAPEAKGERKLRHARQWLDPARAGRSGVSGDIPHHHRAAVLRFGVRRGASSFRSKPGGQHAQGA